MIPRCVIICMATVAVSWSARALADEESLSPGPKDCGMLALYHLLHLEGRPTDLGRLESILGVPTPEGHSFRELREAAARFGLRLDAVALPKQRSAIGGPALVFVKSGRQGHFVVVRPVGHTGRLLQVLDGEHPPIVTDAEWLFSWPSWTGLALVPRRPRWFIVAAISVSAACMVVLAIRLRTRIPVRLFLDVAKP